MTATVPSATSITNQCTSAPATDFGTVLPGTSATTDTGASVCRITFGSSNDTARLRIAQQDAASTAMRATAWDRVVPGQSVKDIGSFGTEVWAVASWGVAMRSMDGGTTWASVATGVTDHLLGVAVVGSGSVVIVGANGRILRTTDGGATWIPQTSGTTAELRDVVAVDANRFVAVGSSDVIRRLDTAQSAGTWTTIASPLAGYGYSAVTFAPGATIGYAVAGDRIVRSVDGGASWSAHAVLPAGNHVDMDAGTTSDLQVVGDPGIIRSSSDGGATWTTRSSVETGMIYGVDAYDARIATAVTWGRRTLRTEDGGATWTVEPTPATSALLGVHMTGPDRVIVGGDADLMRSRDGTAIPDFAAGATTWTLGSGMFGACLQSASGTLTTDWTIDATNVAGRCEPLSTDPWNPIPTVPTSIARTTTTGATGSVDLVFGLRPQATATPGRYRAPIAFTVVAPA